MKTIKIRTLLKGTNLPSLYCTVVNFYGGSFTVS